MLDEDEITLNWHIDTTPIGRARSRSLYDFNRIGETSALPGRIAYERLREMEQEDMKKRPSSQFPSRRVYRQRSSEQHNYSGSNHTPSASRLRALAEYDTELAESEERRKREAEENEKYRSKLFFNRNKHYLLQKNNSECFYRVKTTRK